MNFKRAFEIVNNKEICNVYYQNDPVWIQEINNNIATVGFIYKNNEANVNICDLNE